MNVRVQDLSFRESTITGKMFSLKNVIVKL